MWTIASATSGDRLRSKKVATLPSKTSTFVLPFHTNCPKQHKDTISWIALHYVHGLFYTGSWYQTVKAWRLSEKAFVDSLVAHEGQVKAMLVNQLDDCLFTASTDGAVKLWWLVYGDSSHTLTMVLRFQSSPVNAVALSHTKDTCMLPVLGDDLSARHLPVSCRRD
ncbi:protein JINGUBANG-like [Canna indica]|uniref:Protein JINGUBANG-like n=1 Tax=Canna indica TaxID=4628 RepID=A0AAQ3KK47_9LILI|nr:protein JINGUBANG-like [Canna indica]